MKKFIGLTLVILLLTSNLLLANAANSITINQIVGTDGIIRISYSERVETDNSIIIVDGDKAIPTVVVRTMDREVVLSATEKLEQNKIYELKDTKGLLLNSSFTTVEFESTATAYLETANNVPVDSAIKVIFDRPISIAQSNVSLIDIEKNVLINFSLSINGTEISITPLSALSKSTKYLIEIVNIIDDEYFNKSLVFETVFNSAIISDYDISGSGYTEAGSWGASGLGGFEKGSRYATSTSNLAQDTATWKPELKAGRYLVEIYRIYHTGNTENAEIEVVSANGPTKFEIPLLNGYSASGWYSLGEYNLSAGTDEYVKIYRNATLGGSLRTDAMRFTPIADVSIPKGTLEYNNELKINFSKYMKENLYSDVKLISDGVEKNVSIVSVNHRDYTLIEELELDKQYTLVLPYTLTSYDGYSLDETEINFNSKKMTVLPIMPQFEEDKITFFTNIKGVEGTLLAVKNKVDGNVEFLNSDYGTGNLTATLNGISSLTNVKTYLLDNLTTMKPISNLPQNAELTIGTPNYTATRLSVPVTMTNHSKDEKIVFGICKKEDPTNNIIFIDELKANATGTFTLQYAIKDYLEGGEYIVIVNSETAKEKAVGEFYNLNDTTIETTRAAINNSTTTDEIQEILTKKYRELGIDAISNSLYKELKDKNIINQKLLQKAFPTVAEIKTVFEEILVLEVLNQLGDYEAYLNKFKANYGITLDDYNTISDKAKFKRSFQSFLPFLNTNAVEQAFTQSVAINLVNQSSWGAIEIVLINYDSVFSIKMTDYNNLTRSEKDSVLKSLANKNFQSVSNINKAFNTAVTNAAYRPPMGNKPSGIGSVSKSPETITTDEVPQNLIKEQEKVYGFTDLSTIAWAEEGVNILLERGIIDGFADRTFRGDIPVTREQFIKIIVSAFEIGNENDSCDFSDVKKDDWFYTFVARANNIGIIKGLDNNIFGVSNHLTRQDMAVILVRLIDKLGINLMQKVSVIDYADAVDIDKYAVESVERLQKAGIISGVADNLFAPMSDTTRAMSAKVIYEILKLKEAK